MCVYITSVLCTIIEPTICVHSAEVIEYKRIRAYIALVDCRSQSLSRYAILH